MGEQRERGVCLVSSALGVKWGMAGTNLFLKGGALSTCTYVKREE